MQTEPSPEDKTEFHNWAETQEAIKLLKSKGYIVLPPKGQKDNFKENWKKFIDVLRSDVSENKKEQALFDALCSK